MCDNPGSTPHGTGDEDEAMTGSRQHRRIGLAIATLVASASMLTGCHDPVTSGASGTPSTTHAPATPMSPAEITLTARAFGGKADKTAVSTEAPIEVHVVHGSLNELSVRSADGTLVDGDLEPSTGVWTPAHPLALASTYVVSARAQGADGHPVTTSLTVHTPQLPNAQVIHITYLGPGDGATVGVYQPIVVEFGAAVTDRAAAMTQFTVSATPATRGAWHWVSDRRVDYRPEKPWKLGTTVTVSGDIDGVPLGGGVFGANAASTTFTVTSDVHAVVDPSSLTMRVYSGSKLLRTMPVGLGKPGFQTWGGAMVVLGKARTTRMTSCSTGLACDTKDPNYYDQLVDWTVQLTYSGTYTHAAPWDGLIGRANTSHGCIHLTTADATWFYNLAQAGDLVTVDYPTNTVSVGNGEGDWNLSWAQWTAD